MRFLFIALIATASLTSCHYFGGQRVSGNGHITTMQKNAGSFDGVSVSGQVIVHVRQDSTNSVKIETDENLHELIEVYTRGNTLIIRTREGFNIDPSRDIIAYVSSPLFKAIDISGQCDVIGDSPISGTEPLSMHVSGQGDITLDLNFPKVSTDISGQGNVKLKGQANDFTASVSGQGDVKCFDLVTDNTSLNISGGSDVEITANKQLNIEASGSSSVRYKGNASVSQNISGSGSVKKVG